MLKQHVLKWTKGQVWVVVIFLALIWFAAYRISTTTNPNNAPRWVGLAVIIIVPAMPFLIARILFVWYGASGTPRQLR